MAISNSIYEKIEELRNDLNNLLSKEYGICTEEIINLSKELDNLILIYIKEQKDKKE